MQIGGGVTGGVDLSEDACGCFVTEKTCVCVGGGVSRFLLGEKYVVVSSLSSLGWRGRGVSRVALTFQREPYNSGIWNIPWLLVFFKCYF